VGFRNLCNLSYLIVWRPSVLQHILYSAHSVTNPDEGASGERGGEGCEKGDSGRKGS
jgi:hypothetical protein